MPKLKASWKRVTNAYIAENFKQDGCINCDGKGYFGEDKPVVCSCATLAFRRQGDEQIAAGKLRLRQQLMGKRMVEWFEYRDVGSVEAATEESTLDD